MRIHNEAAVEAQIQELRTITRLQGEPHWGLPLGPAVRQLVILLPTQAPSGKSSRRACHVRGASRRFVHLPQYCSKVGGTEEGSA